jgi:lipopolysaccharide export LptBFGC system permease protein LptF
MKQGLTEAYKMFWGPGNAVDSNPDALKVSAALPTLKATDEFLARLDPQTPAQRQALSAAGFNASLMQNLRVTISLQLASPISWPLLAIVVCWSLLLFCGFGLLSPTNATTLTAMGFGAFAVASALFLIIELSQPYTGLFRIPPAALEQTLDALDR